MRGIVLAGLCLVAVSGCLSAEAQEIFESRMRAVEASWQTEQGVFAAERDAVKTEVASLRAEYRSGAVTQEQFDGELAALNSRAEQAAMALVATQQSVEATRATIAGQLDEARAAAVDEAIETWAGRVESGSRIVEGAAPTVGAVAGTFWPFATFLGGVLAKVAGLLGAAAGAVRRQSAGGGA